MTARNLGAGTKTTGTVEIQPHAGDNVTFTDVIDRVRVRVFLNSGDPLDGPPYTTEGGYVFFTLDGTEPTPDNRSAYRVGPGNGTEVIAALDPPAAPVVKLRSGFWRWPGGHGQPGTEEPSLDWSTDTDDTAFLNPEDPQIQRVPGIRLYRVDGSADSGMTWPAT